MSALVNFLSRAANVLAAAMLCAMFLHIVLEIALRNFWDRSTFVLDEFVGYEVSALAFLALGESFRRGALIEVSLLRDRLSEKGKLILALAARVPTAMVAAVLFFHLARGALRSWENNVVSSSVAETPQFIPESLAAAGAGIFALCVLESAFRIAIRIRNLNRSPNPNPNPNRTGESQSENDDEK